MKRIVLIWVVVLLLLNVVPVGAMVLAQTRADPDYLEAIRRTADMVWDDQAVQLADDNGFDIVNVMWEDTGRYYNSSVGPNISDVSIQVQTYNPSTELYDLTLMPVIRYPNFSDLTADIAADDFYVLVGNEKGDDLERVTLREYLHNFRDYMSYPDSWAGEETSLLASRDSHVLVSAQAAFLPVPQEGIAEFNPVIFNYQSYAGDPAVLTIVATREGTSATIIDNSRDGFEAGWSWGQRLFFNEDGMRASFTGQRLSDYSAGEERPDTSDVPTVEAVDQAGMNMVLLIQVPLKQKEPMYKEGNSFGLAPMATEESADMSARGGGSDVEQAVIGHGRIEGPFTEVDDLQIERDPDFPIRVTVQFYKATSNGIVSEQDLADIAEQISLVYEQADYVGSLVVDGPSDRPTEYDGDKVQPVDWWFYFWLRFEENTGMEPTEVYELWRKLDFIARRFSHDN